MSRAKKGLQITSKFALLDVERGRGPLFKITGYGESNTLARIPVTITGFIVGAWGHDDGTSREFNVEVTAVRVLDGEGE